MNLVTVLFVQANPLISRNIGNRLPERKCPFCTVHDIERFAAVLV